MNFVINELAIFLLCRYPQKHKPTKKQYINKTLSKLKLSSKKHYKKLKRVTVWENISRTLKTQIQKVT